MEKIFGAVILYNPTDEVWDNIDSYANMVSKLFVYDNTEGSRQVSFPINRWGDKVIYTADGVNRGIAERLNDAAKRSIAEGGAWLLTMDQDSSFDRDVLETYLACVHNFNTREQVAMFGVEFEKQPADTGCAFEETDKLITSGSLVSLKIIQEIGDFDEKLFIDEVDSEYCFRANVRGYKTVKMKQIHLNHSLGTVVQHRSLKNLRLTPRTLHTPIRVYYMVRNYLYVSRKYKKLLPASFPYRRAAIINRIKNNMLYGENRWKLLKYLVLALKHYQLGRMGKFTG